MAHKIPENLITGSHKPQYETTPTDYPEASRRVPNRRGTRENRALRKLTGWQRVSFYFFSSFTTSIPNILSDPNHILAVITSVAIELA